MTEEPFNPAPSPPRVWSDKSDMLIPGAGTMGMVILIISLSMIFGASMVLLVIFRLGNPWHSEALVHLPRSLWLSTVLILVSSFTMQSALNAVRADQDQKLLRALTITFALGLIFLVLQSYNWYEVWAQLAPQVYRKSFYVIFFYFLTILHALHVVGGLIPMAVTLSKARRGVYSRNFHPGVRYCTIYWHFLDVVWVVLFALMYVF